MKLEILDQKKESDAICYLCKVGLMSYIQEIPLNYREFDVQRGIVSNSYLDHLADTVAGKKHIPPLVLVADDYIIEENMLVAKEFKILDGLQRTHRLKVINDVINFVHEHKEHYSISDNPGKFSRANSKKLRELGATTKLVKNLIISHNIVDISIEEFFGNNNLWIEVWVNLDKAAQIEKMLLLNAGHKSVNIKHQLELLFIGTLFKLEEISPPGIKIIREKDQSAIQYSKKRTQGMFHFSHILSALISLSAGKIVNTNTDFISSLQSGDIGDVDLIEGFGLSFLEVFISFLCELDKQISNCYGDLGVKWIGREVVLVGMFGAIGFYEKNIDKSIIEVFSELEIKLEKIVPLLNLYVFEEERNKVQLNKVNLGSVNKKAVFAAMLDLLNEKSFSGWNVYFGRSE